jgi:tripartite-type tricarboxylate transporter receptor subunit TctC
MLGNVKIQVIPFKGSGPVSAAVLGNQVPYGVVDVPSALANVRAGKLRALAVTTAKRIPALPDVPTVAEAGVPGYSAPTWSGVIGPANLPRPIVEKLNAAINRAIKAQAFVARFGAIGDEPAGGPPEEFAATIARDSAKWKDVVARSGAKLD